MAEFTYFAGQQRTPEWYQLRLGKVTASRLVDWLAVSKAKTGAGAPLKARLDYEKEILFERTFKTSYDNFVSDAMKDGIQYEQFALKQYEKITGNSVKEAGAWYNEYFVGSPDGIISEGSTNEEGLAEVKVVRDNTFTDILANGVPDKWWKQIQGQLWASGKKWCDFIAINLNTKKIVIIRVHPDKEFHEWLEIAVPEKLVTETLFDPKKVALHDFVDMIPEREEQFDTNDDF